MGDHQPDPDFESFFSNSRFRKLCLQNHSHVELQEYLPGGRKTGTKRALRFAKNVVTGQEVVFKVGQRSRFTCNEVEVMSSLRHPNIITTFWAHISSEYTILCMERAHEDSIQLLERHGRLPEKLCQKIMIQVFEALKYLHQLGIVHRDVKLDNFLLDSAGNLKLSDFEFATRWDPTTFRTDRLGTYEYSSPELRKGSYIGPEIDCWASGVCLYAFVTGCFPFKREQLRANLYNKFIIPPHVTPVCADLITRLLFPLPEQRCSQQQALHHPFCHFDPAQPNSPAIASLQTEMVVDPTPIACSIPQIISANSPSPAKETKEVKETKETKEEGSGRQMGRVENLKKRFFSLGISKDTDHSQKQENSASPSGSPVSEESHGFWHLSKKTFSRKSQESNSQMDTNGSKK